MVHKKYIKINGKLYGPYFYHSYREDGKIKKKYIRIDERRVKEINDEKNKLNYFGIFLLIFIVLLGGIFAGYFFAPQDFLERFPGVFLAPPSASFASIGNANLTIWDDTDEVDVEKYSFCDKYCIQKNKPSSNLWNVSFFANYTNIAGSPIDDLNGNCLFRYNNGFGFSSFEGMRYNSNSRMWIGNLSLSYKGSHDFEVNCTSSFGDIILDNEFTITNTEPYILKTASGFIDFDNDGIKNILQCTEDISCTYNFSLNVSEDDINDILIYGFNAANTSLTDFDVNLETGTLEINVDKSNNAGAKKIELNVRDTESATISSLLDVNILAVNDAPLFVNFENKSFNRSIVFDYLVNITDEENDFPVSLNISFIDCYLAEWSSKTNCELFNSSQYIYNDMIASINFSFVPTRNDVGNYLIMFNITDSGIPNSTSSVLVNFTVVNINENPYFRYICDNERNAVEGIEFNCYINASDVDEVNNLSFFSNQPWFLDFKNASVGLATNFNGSILVNFTADDENVGNWSINVTVADTGSPSMKNSSIFYFFVDNVNDSVALDDLPSFNAFTSNNYTIYINASDNDLIIPDKNVYDEMLLFSSNESWANAAVFSIMNNISVAVINIDPNKVGSSGTHKANISVVDRSGNIDSKILSINVVGNFRPQWDPNTETTHILFEDNIFYLNLSENASDPDGEAINFSAIYSVPFNSFSIGKTTGIINFIPQDADVGEHIVVINISDKASSSTLEFNFTVMNINDAPLIEGALQGNNISVSENNINASEDSAAEIFLFARDDDLKIPVAQRSFYNEILNIVDILEGPNNNLFNFIQDLSFLNENSNRSLFVARFTPRKGDVGVYNVSINLTDSSGILKTLKFNLNILEINHAPKIINLADQGTSANRTFYYDINSSDIEDGNDSDGNLSYSYQFLSGIDFINGNLNIFNTTTGEFNYIFNDNQVGSYHINISVADTDGGITHQDFWIFVYDLPNILFPGTGAIFNLVENVSANLIFTANSTGIGNLTYQFYLDNELKLSTNYYGNGSPLVWNVRPNFSDESYGLFRNITLTVLIPEFSYLNSSRTWGANISHTNAPVEFIKAIGDKQGTIGKAIIINLSEHVYDIDSFDPHYNQSAEFSINSSGVLISKSISNWVLTLTSSQVVAEIMNITAHDLNGSIKMTKAETNNFEIKFEEPPVQQVPVQVPVPTSGGGSSGSSTDKPVSFKIIFPDPVSAKRGEVVELPITIVNDGKTSLKGIDLKSTIGIEGKAADLDISFDKDHIEVLNSGEKEKVILTVPLGRERGLYEITINASVSDPKYTDWGKIYISVEEGETIVERLLFTEEFIVENPECIELKELVDESRNYLTTGDVVRATEKLDEAVNSCKNAISQKSIFSKNNVRAKLQDTIFIYLLVTTIIAIILGIGYYIYKRMALKRALEEVVGEAGI